MLRPLCIAVLVVGCAVDNEPDPRPILDADEFRCAVEPVLMARCGFYNCHGSELRPFRTYAPNRLRLAPSVPQLAIPLTLEERERNLESARAMAIADRAGDTQLLAKPLDADAGGLFHRGKSIYRGRDVFTTADDAGYQRITAWLEGAAASSDCEPTEEIGP